MFIPLISQAQVIRSSDFVYVAKDEIVEGNLYFKAKSLTIEGQVLGDVIGVSPNIQINGHISGDLIVLSQNIQINGQIDGNLRSISNILNINGNINRNVNFLGESMIAGEGSIIGQSILSRTINTELKGVVKGGVLSWSNNVLILGEIAKDVNLTLDSVKRKKYFNALKVGEGAKISGNLNYRAGQEAHIEGESVLGETIKKDPVKSGRNVPSVGKISYLILSSFLLAALLRSILKPQIRKFKKIITKKHIRLSGHGAILLFLTPLAALLLAISIVGIPIAFFIMIIWGALLYLSKIFVGMALGDYIFKIFKKEKISPYLKIISGLILIYLLIKLPYIGWLFSLLAILIFMGAFYKLVLRKIKFS